LVAGCGPRKIEKDVKRNPPEQRTLHTEAGQTTKRAEGGGRIQWVVAWESAELDYLTETEYGGRMKNVKGTIFEEGKAAGTFRADRAEAQKRSNRLKMFGHVVLLSKAPQSTLSCDELEWDAGAEVVKAKQNVNLNTLDYKMGSIPEVWATPKLDVVATPELFEKPGKDGRIKRMDMKTLKMSVALAVAAASEGGAQKPWTINDAGGNMTVENIAHQKTNTVAGGDLEFSFAGTPLLATWESQGITIECARMIGLAEKAEKGKYELANATMSGAVKAVVKRKSSNGSSDKWQTVTATGETAKYDAKAGVLTLSGGVEVVNDDPGAEKKVRLSGKSATINLGKAKDGTADLGIVGATVEGPATIVIDTKEMIESDAERKKRVKRDNAEEKPKLDVEQRTHAEGHGDELRYKLAAGEGVITLSGNAEFDFKRSQWKDGEEDLPKGGVVHLAGSSATLKLASEAIKGEDTLRSAFVEGPVGFSFDGYQKEGGEPSKTHVAGKADKLDYRALDKREREEYKSKGKDSDPVVWCELTLTGGVEVTSKPTGIGALALAKIEGYTKYMIQFDEDGYPVNTEGEGSPGVITIERNPPPAKPTDKKGKKGAGE
jgi:lipopolysaccharide export system protein LptA